MSWADPVIATALAVLAERTATAARTFVTAPSRWNPQDVWLTRVNLRQFDRPRESTPMSVTPAVQKHRRPGA